MCLAGWVGGWVVEMKNDRGLRFVMHAAQVAAGRSLKALLAKIIHVTCVTHVFPRTCEQARNIFVWCG